MTWRPTTSPHPTGLGRRFPAATSARAKGVAHYRDIQGRRDIGFVADIRPASPDLVASDPVSAAGFVRAVVGRTGGTVADVKPSIRRAARVARRLRA
jgi:hypothetical protein